MYGRDVAGWNIMNKFLEFLDFLDFLEFATTNENNSEGVTLVYKFELRSGLENIDVYIALANQVLPFSNHVS